MTADTALDPATLQEAGYGELLTRYSEIRLALAAHRAEAAEMKEQYNAIGAELRRRASGETAT